jgi:hypothetical protein
VREKYCWRVADKPNEQGDTWKWTGTGECVILVSTVRSFHTSSFQRVVYKVVWCTVKEPI